MRDDWKVSRKAFRVSLLEAPKIAGFSAIFRFSDLIMIPAPSTVFRLLWPRNLSSSWSPPLESLGSFTAMTNIKVMWHSMTVFRNVLSCRLRLFFDWTNLGVRSSGDLQNLAGRCSHLVYSVVLKCDKHFLHLLRKLRKESCLSRPSSKVHRSMTSCVTTCLLLSHVIDRSCWRVDLTFVKWLDLNS